MPSQVPESPLTLQFEFVRSEQVKDPFLSAPGPRRYLCRHGPGRYSESTLDWNKALHDDLVGLSSHQPEPESLARLADRLHVFLSNTSWANEEPEIRSVLGRSGRVDIELTSGAAELYALPWELLPLHRGGGRICETPRTLLRYRWPDLSEAPPATQPPGQRMLFAWSDAGGAVGEAGVRAQLGDARSALAQLDELAHVSRRSLRQALEAARAEQRPIDSLFLLCHGAVSGASAGLLWDGPGGRDLISAEDLGRLLGEHAPALRVVLLAACHGGRVAPIGSRLASVALAVHRGGGDGRGPEAVVASRLPLSQPGARLLAREFAALMPSRGVPAAFLAARRAMDPAQGEGRPGSLDHVALQLFAREQPAADVEDTAAAPQGLQANSTLLDGQLQLLTELGADQETATWQALDHQDERAVLLHVLPSGSSAEARAAFMERPLRALKHAPALFLPLAREGVEDGGHLAHVSPLTKRGTFAAALADGALPLETGLTDVASLARGLKALWQAGEASPPLAPTQVILDDEGGVRLLVPLTPAEASEPPASRRAALRALNELAVLCANGGSWQGDHAGVADLLETLQVPAALKRALLDGVTPPEAPEPADLEAFATSLEAALPQPAVTPFAARPEAEAWLERRLQASREGTTTTTLITGSAGSGKSALVQGVLAARIRSDPDLIVLSTTCDGWASRADPFRPLRRILREFIGEPQPDALVGEPADENDARLWRLRRANIQALVERAPDLLGVLVDQRDSLTWIRDQLDDSELVTGLEQHLDASKRSQLDQATIARQLGALLGWLSERRQVVLFVDAMHDMDEASFAALTQLASNPRLGVAFIGALRQDQISAGIDGEPHPLERALRRLRRQRDVEYNLDTEPVEVRRAFTERLLSLDGERFEPSLVESLFEHTGGHPLFTLELVNAMRARGDIEENDQGALQGHPDLDWAHLPPQVEDLIEERLERLDLELRDILGLAAVEGVEFTAEVLARLSEVNERQLLRRLSRELAERHQLVRAGRAERIGRVVLSSYAFESALLRRFLYEDLPMGMRLRLHGDVAEILEELYGERADSVAVALAYHHEQADQPIDAARWLTAVGKRALSVSAYGTARAHLEHALELLESAGPEQDPLRLDIRVNLGNTVNTLEGWSSSNAKQHFDEARRLSEVLELGAERAQILSGFWVFYLVRAELKVSMETAEAICSLAGELEDEAVRMQGLMSRCNSAFWLGDMARCFADREALRALCEAHAGDEEGGGFALNPLINASQQACWSLFLVGELEAAQALADWSVRTARAMENPLSLALALCTETWHHQHLDQVEACALSASRLKALGERHGLQAYAALGQMFQGWAQARAGELEAGLEALDAGFAAWEASSGALIATFVAALRAGLFADAGRWSEAKEAALHGVALAERNHERPYLPELMRLAALAEWHAATTPDDKAAARAALSEAAQVADEAGLHQLTLRALSSQLDCARADGASDEAKLEAALAARVNTLSAVESTESPAQEGAFSRLRRSLTPNLGERAARLKDWLGLTKNAPGAVEPPTDAGEPDA